MTKAGLMLDSGHGVPVVKGQIVYESLNLPPELLPMIPREVIVTKKYNPAKVEEARRKRQHQLLQAQNSNLSQDGRRSIRTCKSIITTAAAIAGL